MNQERMRYDQILQEAAAQQARETNKGKAREVVPDSEEELASSASEEWGVALTTLKLTSFLPSVALRDRRTPCGRSRDWSNSASKRLSLGPKIRNSNSGLHLISLYRVKLRTQLYPESSLDAVEEKLRSPTTPHLKCARSSVHKGGAVPVEDGFQSAQLLLGRVLIGFVLFGAIFIF
ncbi:hypothetical protein PIB30_094213 [Stylosanthes scabra]|uniref:Uncharacterized protein n=1 Tax=Stylosanthes scabra TaxID=79078 RepID=A0ABU6YW00_9FABA|nr:hypothetical protein [Stylosanthes scabra]